MKNNPQSLTKRELEIVKLLMLYLDRNDIAEKLGIKLSTLDSHTRHIREKLGIQSTLQIIKWGFHNKLNMKN